MIFGASFFCVMNPIHGYRIVGVVSAVGMRLCQSPQERDNF
jgi:hypothetical protein